MKEEAEFFIGWDSESSPRAVRWCLTFVSVIVMVVAGLYALIGSRQTDFEGKGSWDFTVRDFKGVLYSKPVPLVILNADQVESKQERICYLVLETKHGVSPDAVEGLHGQMVQIRGSLIQSPGQPADMIAVVSEKEIVSLGQAPVDEDLEGVPEGDVEWLGEIVDSKCYLGAMNPGVYKPHRACAIRCIAGGIPPLFLVRDDFGREDVYLMVGEGGEPLSEDWLDWVAVPVTVRGVVRRVGSWKMLEVTGRN